MARGKKSAHSPRRNSNLYLWDTCPSSFRLRHKSRHTPRQSKQTLQTLTHQFNRETQACIMKHSNSYLRDRHSHQASARTSAESEEAFQRKMKERERADGTREKKCPFPSKGCVIHLRHDIGVIWLTFSRPCQDGLVANNKTCRDWYRYG